MYTNEQISAALAEVVAEKGAYNRYEIEQNTPHKVEAGIQYSYEDCIVGCVIRKVDPELHAKMLEHELATNNSFTFDEGNAPDWVMENFTELQIAALNATQFVQDARDPFGVAQDRFEEVIR